MIPHFEAEGLALHVGDCLDVLATLEPASVDAVVTDPPYGIGFMNLEWDFAPAAVGRLRARRQRKGTSEPEGSGADVGVGVEYDKTLAGHIAFMEWTEAWGREAMRVLKPGGLLVAFGAPRAYQWLAVGLELAGFEMRDSLIWLFGSGFPKSKAINVEGYEGWGTALKPGYEPIALARKPFPRGSLLPTVRQYGTGAINIDATRLERGADDRFLYGVDGDEPSAPHQSAYEPIERTAYEPHELGRWPVNVVISHSPDCASAGCAGGCAVAELDRATGELGLSSGTNAGDPDGHGIYGRGMPRGSGGPTGYGDRGGASRYFYAPKASREEREFGLWDLPVVRRSDGRASDTENPRLRTSLRRNTHPTVKPVELMRWLTRLVTPAAGLVLDPFMGSGTTGIAALGQGFRFLGVELDPEYMEIAWRRITRRELLTLESAPPAIELPQGRLF